MTTEAYTSQGIWTECHRVVSIHQGRPETDLLSQP
jgi:hypothetical protein